MKGFDEEGKLVLNLTSDLNIPREMSCGTALAHKGKIYAYGRNSSSIRGKEVGQVKPLHEL